jgi:hypothetical protein
MKKPMLAAVAKAEEAHAKRYLTGRLKRGQSL